MNQEIIRAEIAKLEARRRDAMTHADLETLDALLDDMLVYTHTDASRDDKASYLAKVRKGVFRYLEVVSIEEQVVVLTSDTACVLARLHLVGQVAGAPRRLDNRSLAVWVRRADGRWRLAAYQPTAMPAAAQD